ncbi:hypothetical protein RPMA_16695 [Tardiphaga alba]|uniref:Uncharacterized protein n=1 Tax=Tardiphaga alba TaxID=340268 RepID=A0ABX8A972_9BRAD|nr:hypothetical protein [Tardiphaga alba]QUS40291.1 hypothetical protein RPMA_16695 [Tardiphaga alba]
MKSIFIIASVIGVLVSTALFVMDRLTDHALMWMSWQMPGIGAAFLFWGAISDSAVAGMAVCLVVNAVVYGAAAFATLAVVRLLAYLWRTQAA